MTATQTLRSTRRPRLAGLMGATALILSASYAWSALLTPSPPANTIATASRPALSPIGTPGDAPLPGTATGGFRAGSLAQIDHSIRAWTKNVAANPHDFISATNLAVLFHGRGRLSFDLGDHERALAAVRTAIAIEPGHAPARALEAAILYTLHDFEAAFEAADALVREDPTQVGALATRFDAELELGRIDAARTDLHELLAIGGPVVTIRAARLASVTGDATTALAKARDAQSAAVAEDTADAGFYAYAVGEYARLAGDASAARAAYRDALAIRADDPASLVGLARIDAFEGRSAAAIAGLRRAIEIAPQPEALALLGDLLTGVGDPMAADAFATVRFIDRLGDIQATTFDRQLVRFELDHGGATPGLLGDARASLAARPDWTGHDTVAWALYRLGRFDEAAAEIAAARALGADDARLRFHEGAILLGQGAVVDGERRLRSALVLGPALDLAERTAARRLLGE